MSLQESRLPPGVIMSPVRYPSSKTLTMAASNRVGLDGHMEGEAEHQCRREDLGNGIGNVLAGNVRR